ncbi:MAG: DNA primase [Bacteroidetes bacterium QS_9_68_14]|nr:MAG: DNA primase [Bacteroidetes bacterium QS_9_68_14]
MPRIPREKIDEVQAAADIVEVASDYVGRLKKSGSRYMALCPFHEEDTPSFSLSPEKNLYYCFGCQAGGSIFTLVQEMEGIPFPKAVEQLADRFGVDLPQGSGGGPERSKREPLHHALRFAARFFYHQLTTTEEGERALRYLTEERGLTEKTIKTFGLGYAPGHWDALTNAAESEQIDPETLEEAGLAIARKGESSGYYDRYRGRVVFPIFSRVGRVLGFAGRAFEDAEGPAIGGDFDPPKYINSPETPVYHKKDVLYGLHQAKNALRDDEEALLVEGYTDVIALHQAGLEHAVATCGTALTAEQAKMLGRYAERVTLLYDADEAGTRATLRGMDRVLEAGLGAYAARLPEGRDPDDFVREEGADRFRYFLRKNRQGVAAFRRTQAERDGAFDTPEDRTRTMRAVAESLALVPDEMARENQVRAASDALGMYENLLRNAVEEARSESRHKKRRRQRHAPRPEAPEDGNASNEERAEQREEASAPLPQERNLLRLLLEHGRPMVELILGHMALTEFTDGPARKLAGHFLEMYREGEVAPRRVLEGDFGPELQQLAAAVLTDEHEPSERWRDRDIDVPRLNQEAREAAASSMRLLKLRRVDAELEKAKAAQFQQAPNEETEREAQQRVMRLQQLRQQIQRGAFFDWDGEAAAA